MMRLSLFFPMVLAIGLLFGCTETPKEETTSTEVYNPNGDSELALAMRSIFDQTEQIKQSLQEGELVVPEGYIEKLRSFHTATPTDPEVKVAEFYGFVKSIELAATALENASPEDQQKTYAQMINTCVKCHEHFCPGPIRRIKKLTLPTAP